MALILIGVESIRFICKILLGFVENLLATKVWPHVQNMGSWSYLLFVGLLVVPFLVLISDRLRKDHRRGTANSQISQSVSQSVNDKMEQMLRRVPSGPGIGLQPLQSDLIQITDRINAAFRDGMLFAETRVSQRQAISSEDLQSVRDAIGEVVGTAVREMQQKFESLHLEVEAKYQLLVQQLGRDSRFEGIVLRYNPSDGVEDADLASALVKEFQPDIESHGSRVFHKKFGLEDHASEAGLENLSMQVIRSMQLAYEIDKDCTLQFGSIAIMKYTDDGLKIWRLDQDVTPSVISCERSPWSLSDIWSGGLAIWTLRGFNLENAKVRASSTQASEEFKVLYSFKTKGGLDVLVCEEPQIIQKAAPLFRDSLHIIASRVVEVDETTFNLQSGAINVKEVNNKAVEDGLTPLLWPALFISLSGARSVASKFWHQPRLPSPCVYSNFKANSVFSNVWSKLHLYKMFGLSMVTIVIPDMIARLWLLLQVFFPALGNVIVALASALAFLRRKGPKIKGIGSSSFRKSASPPNHIKKLNDSVCEFYAPTGDPELEIIFFHGLHLDDVENPYWKTWLSMDDNPTVWPQQWLSETFPWARILSVSYDSSAAMIAGQPDVYSLAEYLVTDIVLESSSNIGQNCPVVLVGHSLGGIVMKQFILSSNAKKSLLGSGKYNKDIEGLNTFLEDTKGGVMKEIVLAVIEKKSSFNSNRDKHQRDVDRIDTFLGNVRGFFYYATPHLGSRLADLAPQVPSMRPTLELLNMLNIQTTRRNEDFRQLRSRMAWRSYAMVEGRKTNFKGFNAIVVDAASARFDVDDFRIVPSADHFTICRPRSTTDTAWVELVRFIKSVVPVGLQSSVV